MIFSPEGICEDEVNKVHHKAYSTVTVDTQKLAVSTVYVTPCSQVVSKKRLHSFPLFVTQLRHKRSSGQALGVFQPWSGIRGAACSHTGP